MPKPLQTLLAGFGPFGTVVSNPAERLLDYFALETVSGHDLTVCPLPTAFRRAPETLRAALEVGGRGGQAFDLILILGIASGSPNWRVERVGRNHVAALADVDGYTPEAGAIRAEAPLTLPVCLPDEQIVAALTQIGLPAFASDSAGAYLCNYVLYTTLHGLRETNCATRAGFLHIPADEQTYAPGITSAPTFSFEKHVLAVRTVLNVLASCGEPVEL